MLSSVSVLVGRFGRVPRDAEPGHGCRAAVLTLHRVRYLTISTQLVVSTNHERDHGRRSRGAQIPQNLEYGGR